MTETAEVRTGRLRAEGASESEASELAAYTQNHFAMSDTLPEFPLPDESFVAQWRSYAALTANAGSIEPLRLKLPQLAFPIEAGMSKTAAYEAATRKGVIPVFPIRGGAALRRPDACRVEVHDSYAGGIGVLTADDRADFETLVRAFTKKNEPAHIPASMGASIVAGYNNWHRIQLLKDQFLRSEGTSENWPGEFQRIKANRELYQDRFLILSNSPYSGVDGQSFGFPPAEWLAYSHIIRLEHECAHYFTRRIFGSMQNNLLDEIMADYAGIRTAFGCFRADYLLHFMGIEAYPTYRGGGRLQNYRGDPPLSDGAFEVLSKLVWKAAWKLEQFDASIGPFYSLPKVLFSIAAMTLDSLAGEDAPMLLACMYAPAVSSGHELNEAIGVRQG